MPVRLWKDMMERHYPNTAWLYLPRDTFDRLYAYRRRNGLASWELAIDQLLLPQSQPVGEEVPA